MPVPFSRMHVHDQRVFSQEEPGKRNPQQQSGTKQRLDGGEEGG